MLAQRWPNNISWRSTLGKCNVAHRGMVGPTVGFDVGPMYSHHFTTSIQCWSNIITPTFEISDIGPIDGVINPQNYNFNRFELEFFYALKPY